MVFGILVAGASSVFIAAPILLFLGDWRRRHGKAMTTTETEAEIIPPQESQPRKTAG